jgi:hypothetical protein
MFLNISPPVLTRFGRSWARFEWITPADTDRIPSRIGYGLTLSYLGIILGDHYSQTPFDPNNGWAPVPLTSLAPLTSNPELNALLSQGIEDFVNRAGTLAPATAPVASATPAQAPVVGTQVHATPQHPVVPTNATQPIAQTIAPQHPTLMDGTPTSVVTMEVDQDVVMIGTPLLDTTPVDELAAISLEDRPVAGISLVLSHSSVNQPQHPSANQAQQPLVSQQQCPQSQLSTQWVRLSCSSRACYRPYWSRLFSAPVAWPQLPQSRWPPSTCKHPQ